MVAERREPRAAAPKSWVQPEPAGKGRAVGGKKKAPAKKKQQSSSQSVKPVSSAAAAAAVTTPVNQAVGVAPQSAIATDSATELQDDFGEQQQAYGQYGGDDGAGGDVSLDNPAATTQIKGGAGPIETETGEQLFCICMGVDNGTPMIFCEACENWFHFECIGLSEEDASRIATYYCDQCQQAGSGKTEWSYDAPSTFDELPSFATEGPPSSPPPAQKYTQPTASTSQLPPLPVPPIMTSSDSGDDIADNAEDEDYFASKQENAEGDTSVKQKSRAESDDDDEDYEEGSTAKRKKKESSATVGTSRLPPLSGAGGNQRRKSSSTGAGNAAKRRKRVVEDEEEAEERRKKAAASVNQFYGSTAKTGPGSTDPLSNPTRKHCIEQLEKILSAIFTSAASTSTEGPSTVDPSRAREYAESIEKELFTHNSELDPKGNPTHSKKYTAKFRTLHFNLKSNDYFRSRVASGQLDAFAIYSMNQEDLLTPEARAEQEAEKLRSLAQSVKVATVQPTTKMTHKGEEILDNYDTGAATSNVEQNEDTLDLQRRGSMGGSVTGDTPHVPNNEAFDSYSDRERSMSLAGSPRMQDSPRFGSPSSMPVFTDSPTGRAFSPVEESPHESASNSPGIPADDLAENDKFARPTLPHHARSDSQSKVKLDLDAVWSNLKPAQTSASPDKEAAESTLLKEKEEDDMDIGSDDGSSDDKKVQEEKEVEEYDPFATDNAKKGNADDEFDALMGGQEGSQENKVDPSKNSLSSGESMFSAKPTDDLANLPSVWEGQINIPDEGSFPARLVQVGGTPFGPHPSIWDRILPKGKIDISGRIDEKAASEYVVQSNFSPSRENVILAILPHIPQTSPSSTLTPDQAARLEKAEAAYEKLVKMYSDRKRYGVAPPSGDLKKVAKDHYIVPLKADKGLPDYVELLDSHILPDKGSRKRDYLLSVLVLQKGLGLNTTHRTKSGGSAPQSSSQEQSSLGHSNHLQPPQVNPSQFSPLGQPGYSAPPAFSSNMSPPYQPPVVPLQAQIGGQATGGPLLDPAALQSLLSNPSLLQALGGGATSQASPIPPPTIPQYGAFSPPPPSAFAGGIPGIAGPPQAPPGVQTWGPPQHYGGFAPPPPPGHWNPAGSPPWQGQPQGPPQPWGNAPSHPPGYIDPERIKAASAEARMIAERDRQEIARRDRGGAGGNGDGSYDYSRGARVGGRGRIDHNDGGRAPRGGRNADAQTGPPPGRRGDVGMNQMQAGISDKGWGRKRG